MLVIKIGGGAAIGEGGFRNFAQDLAGFTEPVVIVHGGNAEFSELSRQLGMPPRMVPSSSGRVSRYTDGPTMDAMPFTPLMPHLHVQSHNQSTRGPSQPPACRASEPPAVKR